MARVLIVDDAAFMRLSMKSMLVKNGFEVVGEAENGEIGVIKYKELSPDIVTMDVTMPKLDGIQSLKLIKEYDSKAKVVMITAMGQGKTVKRAVLNGAKSFIVKPFDEAKLVETLNKVLSL
ncbi:MULTISPECIES: response regulator [Clostridium]|uniref:response regulator n=1 Tax=Clostridium TaxID=1485 RepID=UPI0008250552|nr:MULTISPECIES: response regulator [Clostridium]PJI08207.1 response regulator [Clostridium sp. CT7]